MIQHFYSEFGILLRTSVKCLRTSTVCNKEQSQQLQTRLDVEDFCALILYLVERILNQTLDFVLSCGTATRDFIFWLKDWAALPRAGEPPLQILLLPKLHSHSSFSLNRFVCLFLSFLTFISSCGFILLHLLIKPSSKDKILDFSLLIFSWKWKVKWLCSASLKF